MKEHRLSNNHPMLSMILALLLSTILVDTIAMFARPDTLMWFIKAAVAGIFCSYINGGSHLSIKER